MGIEDVYVRAGEALEKSAKRHLGAAYVGPVEPADVVQTVFLEMLDPHFRLSPHDDDEITERFIRKFIGCRAKDARRDRRRHVRLDELASADWSDSPLPSRVLQQPALTHRSSEDEYFARQPGDHPNDALNKINAAHSKIDGEFVAEARRRIAQYQKRALRKRFRPVVIEILLCRRSFLATLLHAKRRDTYPGAKVEAESIALQTGLTVGGAQNLRTEVIRALRAELHEEIQAAIAKLVKVWKVRPEQAIEIHLRWAEQGGFS